MIKQTQELQNLLNLALNRSMEGRSALTACIGDLFSDSEEVLTERERALMWDIMNKLIHDCEMEVRRSLSERIARRTDAPRDLIIALANDTIDVARPILIESSVLRDEELIEIIRHRTQQHQLSIAMRRSLSEDLSDALVETGDIDVIKTLIENQNAALSEATMEYLAEESRRVDTYQEPLVKRKDLNPELAERMYMWVSAALRSHILENFEVHPTLLDDDLETIVHSIAANNSQGDSKAAANPSTVLARRLAEQKKITPEFLIQTLRQGEIPLFEALFQEVSGIEPPKLQRVLYESGGEGLAIACRALEMLKPNFATIFLLSRKGRPGNHVVDPKELSRALLIFDKIMPEAAMHVVKSWRRDIKYQDAVETVPGKARKQEAG